MSTKMLLARIKSEIKLIFFIFLIWRSALFLIAYVAPYIIKDFGARFPYWEETLVKSRLPQFIWAFGNFDGVHYLRIAQDGYAYQYTQVFFPFYPIFIKLISFVTFGNLLIAGLLISNSAFFIALLIFFKLIKRIYDEKIALWSTIFLLAFPTSFYFGSVYTEGLFFLMIISAFSLAQKNKILLASIVGAFSGATRLVGVFLAVSLLKKNLKGRNLLPLIIVPLGFILYVIYLKVEFNNPLYFLTAQKIFGQERTTSTIVILPQIFWRYLKILATTNGLLLFNAAFELISAVFAIILLIFGTKIIKREWLIFSWLAILTPTLSGTFASMPRYILIAFPIYIVLAHINSDLLKAVVALLFAIILAISTTLFTRGYWVA